MMVNWSLAHGTIINGMSHERVCITILWPWSMMIKSDAFLMSANQIRTTTAELNAKTAAVCQSIFRFVCAQLHNTMRDRKRGERKTITLNHITLISDAKFYIGLRFSFSLYSVLLFEMVSVLISEFVFTLMLLLILLPVHWKRAREGVCVG